MKNILLTGEPGIGKTTLIEKLIENLRDLNPSGFITKEIREGTSRVGFSLNVLGGPHTLLAHVNIHSRRRVSRYGVDVDGFETMLRRIDLKSSKSNFIVIDEIGKMECFSELFILTVEELLQGDKLICATVALKGGGFRERVKKRKDCRLIRITRENRNELALSLVKDIRTLITTL